jgi:hypothetical protein
MMDMISLYLEQTPPLILAMKKSMRDKDWNTLYATVHKMIPSFSIMGMNPAFEQMARKVQDYASARLEADEMPEMIHQLENICAQACEELKEDFNTIKKTTP